MVGERLVQKKVNGLKESAAGTNNGCHAFRSVSEMVEFLCFSLRVCFRLTPFLFPVSSPNPRNYCIWLKITEKCSLILGQSG